MLGIIFMIRMLACLPFLVLFGLLAVQTVVVEEVKPTQPKKKVKVKKDDLPEELRKGDILAFLNRSLKNYEAKVKGYKATLVKQERIGKRLKGQEIVECEFREDPHSVFMYWKKLDKSSFFKAKAAVFAKGKHKDKIVLESIIPFTSLTKVLHKPLNDSMVKSSSRYGIDKFGIKYGLLRVIDTWSKRQAEGTLFVKFKGIVEVPELDNQKCYVIHRDRFTQPEEDDIFDVVLYFDVKNLMQVGSVLHNKKKELVAYYFWKDLEINPDYPENYFTEALLKKK